MLGDAYLLKEVSLGNIGFASGSVFASGSDLSLDPVGFPERQ